ncbi:hypothetical protein HDV05_008435 [Chytridiales sp. JEL 0842]|nr:hypothetical protein HDV05_008435 [Chytridiales sp. JEL 0842]
MASGFGTSGGRGRCFPFFQDFAKCYVQADSPKECVMQFEDYQECLFHRKELLRLTMVKEEWEKKKAAEKPQEPKGKYTGIPGAPI